MKPRCCGSSRNVNKGAASYDDAPIKRIEALEIGRDAVASWQRVREQVFHSVGGSHGPMGMGRPMGMPLTEQRHARHAAHDDGTDGRAG